MQLAWIISVHLVEVEWSETSPALGLRVASGSKNTIRKVTSHELKITRHSFPVSPPTPAFLQPAVFRDRRPPSSQPDEKNLWEEERRRGRKERKAKSDVNTWPTYPGTGPTHLPPRYYSSEDVFAMFHYISSSSSFFLLACSERVN